MISYYTWYKNIKNENENIYIFYKNNIYFTVNFHDKFKFVFIYVYWFN